MKITSEKKIAANRANGALSHGPTTPEGKARSAQNATRHGFLSQIVCVRNESKEAFEIIMDDYCQRLGPVDEVEKGLIEEMVACSWRTRRAIAIETQMMDAAMESHPTANSEIERLTSGFSDLSGNPKLNTLLCYQARLHHQHPRLLRDFILLRKSLPPAPIAPDLESVPAAIPAISSTISVPQTAAQASGLPCPDSSDHSSPEPMPDDAAPDLPAILPSASCLLPSCSQLLPNEPITPFPSTTQPSPFGSFPPLDIDETPNPARRVR